MKDKKQQVAYHLLDTKGRPHKVRVRFQGERLYAETIHRLVQAAVESMNDAVEEAIAAVATQRQGGVVGPFHTPDRPSDGPLAQELGQIPGPPRGPGDPPMPEPAGPTARCLPSDEHPQGRPDPPESEQSARDESEQTRSPA